MKKISRIVIILAAAVLAFGVVSCTLNAATLSSTEWTNETLGTGTGLRFTSATAGHWEAGVLTVWTAGRGFTCTFSGLTNSGTNTDNGSTASFTVADNKLTNLGVDCAKK